MFAPIFLFVTWILSDSDIWKAVTKSGNKRQQAATLGHNEEKKSRFSLHPDSLLVAFDHKKSARGKLSKKPTTVCFFR